METTSCRLSYFSHLQTFRQTKNNPDRPCFFSPHATQSFSHFILLFHLFATGGRMPPSMRAQTFQPELLAGQSIYWAAMPNPTIIFHSDDWTIIPFSLLSGGSGRLRRRPLSGLPRLRT
jgi:hypothetical protein